MINISINNQALEVKAGKTILQVAKKAGLPIPTICHLPGLESRSVCRICSVEVEGHNKLLPACSTVVEENMQIQTQSTKTVNARKVLMEFIIAEHGGIETLNTQVREYASQLGVNSARFYLHDQKLKDCNRYSSDYIQLAQEKCIHCDRCIRACRDSHIINRSHRGSASLLTFGEGDSLLDDTACSSCGDCVPVCPTGAIYSDR
ncbi:MAG: 2Fe-2S iron-sulfur cluster-binding protein [Gammaproteobacteria bacterium]|nr:2Fe-2S iron-sulfur cluster-binding protein [Gammaproteobacteria bacterium]